MIDFLLKEQTHVLFLQANQGTSERMSMGSRHRRRSVPSFSSGLLGSTRGSRRSARAGSVDPLLDGSYSDSAESNGKHGSAMMLHRDFDR